MCFVQILLRQLGQQPDTSSHSLSTQHQCHGDHVFVFLTELVCVCVCVCVPLRVRVCARVCARSVNLEALISLQLCSQTSIPSSVECVFFYSYMLLRFMLVFMKINLIISAGLI